MPEQIRRLAFVGIGNMGWPMAQKLLEAGFELTVADAVPGRAARFAGELGGHAAADAAEAAAGADALITILPTSRHVSDVVEEVAGHLPPGALFIEMSSGSPEVTRQLATRLLEGGVDMIDCPVSGGVPRARSGELSIMAGGDVAALDRAEPVLRAMGTTIHRCGGIGAGQAMKALNNLVSAGGFLIGVEAMLVGQKFGLDPALMVEVLNASTGMNNSTQKKFRQFVLSRRFDAGFGLDLMVKDLSIALEVARENGVPVPFAALCREMWSSAAGMLGPGQDHTALARFSEALAGTALGGGNDPPRDG
ncbi:NAD(P)-dependent oxidoreductase [Pseudoroseomonas globiformis]|uniref:NAD(P)-dependent oxidoreductase n=1 Tax=Teichococcus globiformis TaxID=2307229 RepID=A0ABV7FZ72_9PROT